MVSKQSWEYNLREQLLLLATVVVTMTYAAGFNVPGGVWPDTADHLAGDPIIRATDHRRYLIFFYCNAIAFSSSVVMIVLFLVPTFMHEVKKLWVIRLKPLRWFVMLLGVLSLMGAYAAGTCQDMLTTVYSSVLVAIVFTYFMLQKVLAWHQKSPDKDENSADNLQVKQDELRKVLMLLATFAVSVTYAAGLSTPGGFWDNTNGGHRAGDVILEDHHKARLTAFFVCNTTSYFGSLLVVVLLLDKTRLEGRRFLEMFGCIVVVLVGLVMAYAAGSCREAGHTAYVGCLGAACLGASCLVIVFGARWRQQTQRSGREELLESTSGHLLLLLSTFATTITYQAGLDPPGGLWQDNGDGYLAGDPILLTTNTERYKTFFYCNSIAFVASLVTIFSFLERSLIWRHMVKAAIMLELFGLVGAYAAGACRDVNTSIYVMALGGAVLFYVVIHVAFLAQDNHHGSPDNLVGMKRKLLFPMATLAPTMTYQAGLTPPSGFWLQDDELTGHHAGDPVLLYNYPRRYNSFFYCNSVSFMLSIVTIILLINPNLYMPVIRTNALSVSMAAGLFGLMGAYAAGSSQHLQTSIGVFVSVAVVMLILVTMFVIFFVRRPRSKTMAHQEQETTSGEISPPVIRQMKYEYLMLLGILVASVTYQAGLDQPGGVWQRDGHDAGNPVMQDSRRQRYLVFFYSNSISFVASIVFVLMLLRKMLQGASRWTWLHRSVMNMVIMLDILALLVSYVAASTRDWKTSVCVAVVVSPILIYYVALQLMHTLQNCCRWGNGPRDMIEDQSCAT